MQLLTQQQLVADAERQAQRTRFKSVVIILAVLALSLLAVGLLYWRLRLKSSLLAQANETNQQAAAEKEVLLQEVHHRVKNNLQLVSSLLAWQRSTLLEPAVVEALDSSQARIQSMALVHEVLYRADDLARVRLDTYLAQLLESLHRSLVTPQRPVRLRMELAPLEMNAKDAGALGLLVNELVTNAFKHAFSRQARGALTVCLAARPAGGFQLSVADDGLGLPPPGAGPRPESMGTQLINTLARQLSATVTVSANTPAGTRVEVTR